MNNKPPIATSTSSICKQVASELEMDSTIVRNIVDKFFDCVIIALECEMPVIINRFCKFYFKYINRNKIKSNNYDDSFYKNKVHRELAAEFNEELKQKMNSWVHDIGLKNNKNKDDFARLKLKPQEICNIRRQKILEEQKSIGFDVSLLFDKDKIPADDKFCAQHNSDPPTVNEIIKRLGLNLKDLA